jgi:cytidylate kinase
MGRIITIGREFGSGGREIGRRIADELHIAYYDSEILEEIVKKTPYSQEYIEEITQGRPISLFPIHYANSWGPVVDPHLQQAIDVYQEQANILRELADKSDCVILGRCADYILRDRNPFRIFVYSDMETKLARCKSREKEGEALPDKQMIKRIRKIDKRRRQYYEFYTGQKWGGRENYDLMINTANSDIKKVASVVAKLFE